jgi:NAD/NADP transhydrogenase alpha subunit
VTATAPRRLERTIHPARRAAGVALTGAGALTATLAVVTGATALLAGVGAVVVGFVVSHRWTRPRPAEITRLASERHGSADYTRRSA